MRLLVTDVCSFFFFQRKTAYECRISDWSSDVYSSDLPRCGNHQSPDSHICFATSTKRGSSAGQGSRRPRPAPSTSSATTASNQNSRDWRVFSMARMVDAQLVGQPSPLRRPGTSPGHVRSPTPPAPPNPASNPTHTASNDPLSRVAHID